VVLRFFRAFPNEYDGVSCKERMKGVALIPLLLFKSYIAVRFAILSTV